MKSHLPAAVAALLLALPSLSRAQDTAPAGSPPPEIDSQKIGYSMGVETARNIQELQKHGFTVDPDAIMQGLKDGLGKGPAKMTDAEVEETMQALGQELHDKVLTENKAAGEKYLVDNGKKDGWKTTASGLEYKVITSGTGDKPKSTDTVVVNYRGTTIDGTEFDSSYKRNQPMEISLANVIPGWSEALQLMPAGSKWQLAIPADLAYGASPPPGIEPNSVLLFNVELLGIKQPGAADSGPGPAPGGQ